MLLENASIIAAGLLGGGLFGSLILTRSEMKKRGFHIWVNPLDKVSAYEMVKIVLITSLCILIVAGLVLALALVSFRIAGIHYFNNRQAQSFGLAFLAGAGTGKYLRYLSKK